MKNFLERHELVLMEAAVVEPIRRSGVVELDPILVNTNLIYGVAGRNALSELYLQYCDVAVSADLPFMMCAPTWRANAERVAKAQAEPKINQHAVEFMRELCERHQLDVENVKIGGMVGCKNDCYRPEESLSAALAEEFHAWQIDQLALANVDFLQAVTIPSVAEAIGIANAMAATEIEYLVSFVINRHGQVLDGTPLQEAMDMVDNQVRRSPLGYMVNCAHPSFLASGNLSMDSACRLIGFQGNASSLDHGDLDGALHLQVDDISDWGNEMLRLRAAFGLRVLGGCCGTNADHLRYLVEHR